MLGVVTGKSSGNSLFIDIDGHQEPQVPGGSVAPGSGGGTFAVVATSIGATRCALNDRSDLAFVGDIEGGIGSSGLFVLRGDAMVPVALEGQPAAGTDRDFADFRIASAGINGDGDVTFWSRLSQDIGDQGIFLATRVAEVELDIASEGRAKNLPASPSGLVSVVLFGSDRFDVSEVDASSLTFGPGQAEPVHARGGHLRDANGDGFADLVSHYRIGDTNIEVGGSEACVRGNTLAGRPFQGCDEVMRRSSARRPRAAPAIAPGAGHLTSGIGPRVGSAI